MWCVKLDDFVFLEHLFDVLENILYRNQAHTFEMTLRTFIAAVQRTGPAIQSFHFQYTVAMPIREKAQFLGRRAKNSQRRHIKSRRNMHRAGVIGNK